MEGPRSVPPLTCCPCLDPKAPSGFPLKVKLETGPIAQPEARVHLSGGSRHSGWSQHPAKGKKETRDLWVWGSDHHTCSWTRAQSRGGAPRGTLPVAVTFLSALYEGRSSVDSSVIKQSNFAAVPRAHFSERKLLIPEKSPKRA